jgi:hypothetical protein
VPWKLLGTTPSAGADSTLTTGALARCGAVKSGGEYPGIIDMVHASLKIRDVINITTVYAKRASQSKKQVQCLRDRR